MNTQAIGLKLGEVLARLKGRSGASGASRPSATAKRAKFLRLTTGNRCPSVSTRTAQSAVEAAPENLLQLRQAELAGPEYRPPVDPVTHDADLKRQLEATVVPNPGARHDDQGSRGDQGNALGQPHAQATSHVSAADRQEKQHKPDQGDRPPAAPDAVVAVPPASEFHRRLKPT